METPDPPNDTPGALQQVVLTQHDIPWSLRVIPKPIVLVKFPILLMAFPWTLRAWIGICQ